MKRMSDVGQEDDGSEEVEPMRVEVASLKAELTRLLEEEAAWKAAIAKLKKTKLSQPAKRVEVKGEFSFNGTYSAIKHNAYFEYEGGKVAQKARELQTTQSEAAAVAAKAEAMCAKLFRAIEGPQSRGTTDGKKGLKGAAKELQARSISKTPPRSAEGTPSSTGRVRSATKHFDPLTDGMNDKTTRGLASASK